MSVAVSNAYLEVVQGPFKGNQYTLTAQGARLGRASKNDIVLPDEGISRFHCRVFFKEDGSLWVTDLGSANQTTVNDHPVTEVQLHVGDRIGIYSTEVLVLRDNLNAAPGLGTVPPPGVVPSVDLGLKRTVNMGGVKFPLPNLYVLAGSVLALLVLVFALPLLFKKPAAPVVQKAAAPAAAVPTLEISYEKVQADTNNVFRYELTLSRNRVLSVQVDDVRNNRHVRKEKIIGDEFLKDLITQIESSGFFLLKEEYTGLQPNALDRWDISITLGRTTHRALVANRVEPEPFKNVRELIEVFGKNELGLWAIQFTSDKLQEMAQEASTQAAKLYAERMVTYGNTFEALRKFKEAEWYLETVEPKPAMYAEILARITDCEQEVQQKYEQQNFLVSKALRESDWQTAANELRVICEMIPDRSDSRHQEARKRLLDAESHLKVLR